MLIDNTWWGLPETAIKVCISLCPDCLSTTKVPVGESLNPLKMRISNTIGVRAQMDLILQSDSGSPVCKGEFFKTVKIVKGKPCRPNEEGSVE